MDSFEMGIARKRQLKSIQRPITTCIVATVLATAAECLHYHYFVQPLLRPGGYTTGLRASIWLLLLVAAWVATTRILARLSPLSWQSRLGWLAASAGAGALAIFVIPLAGLSESTHWNIRVTATGNKNPNARSSEVWLNSFTAGGKRLGLGEFTREGNWDSKDGSLFSVPPQPAVLTWSGEVAGPIKMVFSSHPWCGTVAVVANDKKFDLDLYCTASTERVISLPATEPIGTGSATRFRLSQWLVFTAVFLIVGLVLATRGSSQTPRPPGPSAAFMYAGACAVIWCAYLVAFWPGALSPDSTHQWAQILDLSRLNDDHPFSHTLMMWLITRIWQSPAAVAMAQILALSGVVGWGVASLRRAGVPRWAGILVTSLIALSPATGRMTVTLWKDIPFCILVFANTVLLFNTIMSRGSNLRKPQVWIGFGVCIAAMPLFRHEAIIGATGTLVLLLVGFRRYWKNVLYSAALAGYIYLGMTIPAAQLLHVRKAKIGVEYLMLHHIAAHWANGTPFTQEEKEVIASIHPPGDNLLYTPYTVRPLLPHLDRSRMQERREDVKRVFWATLIRRPSVNFQHLFIANQFVWRITPPAGVIYDTAPIWLEHGKLRYITENRAGLTEHSLAPEFARSLVTGWGWASDPVFKLLVWHIPLWFYLGLAGAGLAAVRLKRPDILLVTGPVLLQSMTAALLPISNNFRYIFGVYLTSMLLIGLLFIAGRAADPLDPPVPPTGQPVVH